MSAPSHAMAASYPAGHPIARSSKRTPMACQFCRARKLKCDGRETCANCSKRGGVCIYTPVSQDPFAHR